MARSEQDRAVVLEQARRLDTDTLYAKLEVINRTVAAGKLSEDDAQVLRETVNTVLMERGELVKSR